MIRLLQDPRRNLLVACLDTRTLVASVDTILGSWRLYLPYAYSFREGMTTLIKKSLTERGPR